MALIQHDIPLKEHTSFRIGGNARYFLRTSDIDDLKKGLEQWKELAENFDDEQERVFVLGAGTNLLVSEKGFPGLVIHPEIKFIEKSGSTVKVGAGDSVSSLIDFCLENSLAGLEWAGGLPGTVGGAVRGNAGAFGGETKDSISLVESIDIGTLQIKKRNRRECKFNYRDSVFKSGDGQNEIVTSAQYALSLGDADVIRSEADDHIEYRKSRHPLHLPNAGSIFKNVAVEKISPDVLKQFEGHIKNDPFPVLPAAKIIAESGIVGKRIGDAQVSETHPNFIVNVGEATAQNVKDLIAFEQEAIKEKYGIDLEPEIMMIE